MASDITDADVGSGTFQVTETFNDAMTTDGSADPTLTFNPAAASTLTFSGGVWSAGGFHVYGDLQCRRCQCEPGQCHH